MVVLDKSDVRIHWLLKIPGKELMSHSGRVKIAHISCLDDYASTLIDLAEHHMKSTDGWILDLAARCKVSVCLLQPLGAVLRPLLVKPWGVGGVPSLPV